MDLPVPFISRVRLENYRSIAHCDVELGPLTVLVGANGAGKSNFLDALRFVATAVSTSPDQAITERGGLREILHRSPDPAPSFSIDLEFTIPWGHNPEQWVRGTYGFTVAPSTRRGQRPFVVESERLRVAWDGDDEFERFDVERGAFADRQSPVREGDIDPGRLYLTLASVRTSLAPLYGGLRGIYVYDPDLKVLRALHQLTEGDQLGPSGEYLGSVLGSLQDSDRQTKERIDAYLSAVVPELVGVDRKYDGSHVTVELRTRPRDASEDREFGPEAMSNGTIRAAGLLAALFQPSVATGRTRLVGIEEPELAVHPAAAGVLFDAMTEASENVQIVVTTQSPDLLDRDDLAPETIRVAEMRNGATLIGMMDAASLKIVGDGLASVGRLLRGNQITVGGDR
jgi:predicted ATPase